MATKLGKYTNSPPKPVVGSSAQWNDGTTSRTMMLAQTSLNVPYTWSLAASGRKSTSEVIPSSRPNRREISGPKPTSSAAQYWAARALTAEALLSARETHHAEMQSLSHAEDAKRNREISNLAKEHKERYVWLERLVIVLLASLCSLVALVIYLAAHYTRQTSVRHPWSLPSHFTIPILSPFTSVVEHETSVIGSKVITVGLLLATGMAYLMLRQRISRTFG